MEKYKMGDMIKTKKGDRAIIVDIIEDDEKAIIFNLSKMHPGKIKIEDIKEKVNDPNCKVIVERIGINKNTKNESEDDEEIDEDEETIETLIEELEEEKEKHQETKDELIITLKKEVNFIENLVNNIIRKITE